MTFTAYANTGPFSNGIAPGISATFLNNVESFLDQFVSNATRIAKFTATVTATPTFFNHNLGVVPDLILFNNSTLHATVLVATYEASSMTSTQVKMSANNTVDITGIAIKF